MDIMSLDFFWSFWSLGATVVSVGTLLYWKTSRLPATLPWVGLRDEYFSRLRAWIRELSAGHTTLSDGYSTYNTKGKSFILLDTAGRPQVIMPKEYMRWLVGQPVDVLSQGPVVDVKLGIKYLGPRVRNELRHELALLIRRNVTRDLGKTQSVVFNAMRESVDSLMGLDETEWHQVNLLEILQPVTSSAAHYIFFGEALSRNDSFVEPMGFFSMFLGFSGVVIGQYVPYFMTPVVGYLVNIFACQYRRRFMKHLLPVVQNRMDRLERIKTDPAASHEMPKDLIQYAIMNCKSTTALEIADAILSLSLGTDHATSTALYSVFLDLLSSPPELEYFKVIHDEAAAVFRREEDWVNSASLHKLTHSDSALRESLRQNPIFGRGAMQEVMPSHGVTLPDGHHVPRGTWLGVSMADIHMDERYYPDPRTYDPFRFSRARAELVSRGEVPSSISSEAVGDRPNGAYLSMTDEAFASFGFGRHACPGRWFASHLMKMTLAYIALNYEIQPIVDRPPNTIIGDCIVSPQSVKIKIRRRKANY